MDIPTLHQLAPLLSHCGASQRRGEPRSKYQPMPANAIHMTANDSTPLAKNSKIQNFPHPPTENHLHRRGWGWGCAMYTTSYTPPLIRKTKREPDQLDILNSFDWQHLARVHPLVCRYWQPADNQQTQVTTEHPQANASTTGALGLRSAQCWCKMQTPKKHSGQQENNCHPIVQRPSLFIHPLTFQNPIHKHSQTN